jgi:hypothetical protein
MADTLTPQQLAQLQARVDADPQAQAVIRRIKAGGGFRGTYPVEQVAKIGYMPPGYRIEGRTGRVARITDFPKEQLIPWGAIAGVGLPLSGLFTAGAGAGGGGGAAALETPGTVNLASAGGAGATAPVATGAATGAGGAAVNAAGKSASDKLLGAAFTSLAGLPTMLSGSNQPSAEEQSLQAQIMRLLSQQEQRTTYSNPLHQAATQMAYDLLPKRSGNYPGGG